MVSPLPSPTSDEDPKSSPPPLHSEEKSFANGLGMSPAAAMRFSALLTRENIGWSLVMLVAADYFGITDQVMAVVLGVC